MYMHVCVYMQYGSRYASIHKCVTQHDVYIYVHADVYIYIYIFVVCVFISVYWNLASMELDRTDGGLCGPGNCGVG